MKKPRLTNLDTVMVLVFVSIFMFDIGWVTYAIHYKDINYYLGL